MSGTLFGLPKEIALGARGYEHREGMERRETEVTSVDPIIVSYVDSGDVCRPQTEGLITRSVSPDSIALYVGMCPSEQRERIESDGMIVEDVACLLATKDRLEMQATASRLAQVLSAIIESEGNGDDGSGDGDSGNPETGILHIIIS